MVIRDHPPEEIGVDLRGRRLEEDPAVGVPELQQALDGSGTGRATGQNGSGAGKRARAA